MHFCTPLYLLMIHHEETWLKCKFNITLVTLANPKEGYKSALAVNLARYVPELEGTYPYIIGYNKLSMEER